MKPSLPKIAKVVVGLPVDGPFDYAVPVELQKSIAVGKRVLVSFHRQKRVGFVVGFANKSNVQCLDILSILDQAPTIDAQALELTQAISEHYGCSWGEAIEVYYPSMLRKGKVTDVPLSNLNTANKGPGQVSVIYDKTLEARWPILLEAIQKNLNENKNIIILVPEAVYIKRVMEKLKSCLSAELMKRVVEIKSLDQWFAAKRGDYCIVVGTRSSVFAPLGQLGAIVMIDEENTVYKQEQSPYYHAREVVLMRRDIEHCDVIFVTSAPSVELWFRAAKEKWNTIVLSDSASTKTQLVDMTNYTPGKSSLISVPLQNLIQNYLKDRKKIIIYLNRRGMASFTRCNQCGFTIQCKRCDINMKVVDNQQMICGRCDFKMPLPKICPHCKGDFLRSMGKGIDRIASDLSKFYAQAIIRRYDKETEGYPEGADIVIATQAILKQKDHLRADAVAVINFDAELNHLDFRSASHAFALMAHLRQMAQEKFVIQTHMRDHYCLQAAVKMDFKKFYREELKFRKQLNLPPFKHLVILGVRGPEEKLVIEQAKQIALLLKEKRSARIHVSEPHPDTPAKLRDNYRYMILLKGASVESILKYVKSRLKLMKRLKRNIVTVIVDW